MVRGLDILISFDPLHAIKSNLIIIVQSRVLDVKSDIELTSGARIVIVHGI